MRIERDKVLHLGAGLVAWLAAWLAASNTGATHTPELVAWALCVAVAGGKELWDRHHPGRYVDGWDAYATTVGGLLGHVAAVAWKVAA